MTFCSILAGLGFFVLGWFCLSVFMAMRPTPLPEERRKSIAFLFAFILGCFVASLGEQISCDSDDSSRIEYDGRTMRPQSK
jgi:hypothetical protein